MPRNKEFGHAVESCKADSVNPSVLADGHFFLSFLPDIA